MCILFFAIKQHPNYPLIICANRDEFHQRATNKMHFWAEQPILAGKDLLAGGTWLGLTAVGRFSALTNFRQPLNNNDNKQSRGHLVTQALNTNLAKFPDELVQQCDNYNGFNLVYGTLDNLHCFDSVNQRFHKITEGFHSICNGALDDIWPKMALGRQKLADTITTSANDNSPLEIEDLFNLMSNNEQADINVLPNTGVGAEWEQFLSSIFIKSISYGTRSTTIIRQDLVGKVEIYERSFSPQAEIESNQYFELLCKRTT